MNYYSEWSQDSYMDILMKFKENGTFVDIGANEYNTNNNSYFFELERNFTGIGIDIDPQHTDGWAQHRKSPFICDDATKINYSKLFKKYNLPKVIDFLSVDVDPAEVSMAALIEVIKTGYQFNIIDFEVAHDEPVTLQCKKLLESKGYRLVKEIHIKGHYHLDDIYVHNSFYEEGMEDWI